MQISAIIMFLVTAKIRNIHDYHIRIQHGTPPLPSAVDITNTIKYFHQVLLGKHLLATWQANFQG